MGSIPALETVRDRQVTFGQYSDRFQSFTDKGDGSRLN